MSIIRPCGCGDPGCGITAPDVRFDTERELGYTQGESGVVCPDTSESVTPPRAGSATRPDFRHQLEEIGHASATAAVSVARLGHALEPHPLRCVCEPCLAERERIREDAFVEMTATLPKRTWARRSWNGPIARFPGTESDDAGRMRLRRRPR